MLRYLSQIYGNVLYPLTYNVKDIRDVDNNARDAAYATDEDRLVQCTLHMGICFKHNNSYVYKESKALVADGPGWAFVQQYSKRSNKRGA